jgi:diacylglycerol kinase (ATP)
VKVAVVAHSGKTLGGGLSELRRALAAEGIDEPFWCEVPKSRKAPAQVQRAVDGGAELVFAWGGDGMVQRCVDVLAGTDVRLAIVPAGTANLFASNLGIPKNIEQAVAIGLHGERHALDVGSFNGERFAVMAGAGFDAAMIRDAGENGLKDRVGRVAYVWTGSRNLRAKPFRAKIDVDGVRWYSGKASCILLGNVGDLFGGVEAFEDARPDDGLLELGVVTAEGVLQWGRMLARTAVGAASKSPFAHTTKVRSVKVRLSRKVLYELDGGARTKAKRFKVRVEPGAITVCVPKTQLAQTDLAEPVGATAHVAPASSESKSHNGAVHA